MKWSSSSWMWSAAFLEWNCWIIRIKKTDFIHANRLKSNTPTQTTWITVKQHVGNLKNRLLFCKGGSGSLQGNTDAATKCKRQQHRESFWTFLNNSEGTDRVLNCCIFGQQVSLSPVSARSRKTPEETKIQIKQQRWWSVEAVGGETFCPFTSIIRKMMENLEYYKKWE